MSGLSAMRRRAMLYGLILVAGCFSLADAIADVTLTWVIASHTESAGWLGVAGALGMIPLIAGAFFGGKVVDRIGARRTAMLAACLGLTIAIVIPVMIDLMGIVLPLLLICIFAAELFDTPAELAIEAQLPELARFGGMPLERLNALDELVETIAGLSGPLIAGIVVTRMGTVPALWIVAAIAAIGVGVLWQVLPNRPEKDRRRARHSDRMTIPQAASFIWRTPVLRWIISFSALLVMLLASMDVVLIPIVMEQAGWSAQEYGWVLAAGGLGAVTGTAAYAWKGHLLTPRIVVVVGILGTSGAVGALAVFSDIAHICLAVAAGSAAAGPISPLLNTQMQRQTPRANRGGILGVGTGLVLLCLPPGFLVIGLGAELLGAKTMLVCIAVTIASTSIIAMTSPAIRGLANVIPESRTRNPQSAKDRRSTWFGK